MKYTLPDNKLSACSQENCGEPVFCRGFCRFHYDRQRRGMSLDQPKRHRDPCLAEGCGRPSKALGLCNKHYQNFKANGDLASHRRVRGICTVGDCQAAHWARGYCRRHYMLWRTNGKPERVRPTGNKWINNSGYVVVYAGPRRGSVLEHRLVVERTIGRPLLPSETVHHVNGDKTDNRPENLELWASIHPRGVRVGMVA